MKIVWLAAAIAAVTVSVPYAQANDTGYASTTHDVRREGGRLCIVGHTHGGTGTGGTKGVALVGAIKAFTDTTGDEYGTDWAKWSKSASKQVNYTKTADGWSAAAEARPCK